MLPRRRSEKDVDAGPGEMTLSPGASHAQEGLIPGSPTSRSPKAEAPANPPSLQRETCIIVSFMVFLLLVTGSVLGHFERKRRVHKIAMIQHAFVYSRGKTNNTDNQLARLRRQLEALGLDSARRITVSALDPVEPLNTTDKMVRAAANLTADGRYGRELLAYRRLVEAMAKWAARAPAEPVVLLASQRAVVTPGGASVIEEALKYLESGAAGGWDALYAGHCGECGWWTPPRKELSSAAFPLGSGLGNDADAAAHFAQRRARDVGCGTLLSRTRDAIRHGRAPLADAARPEPRGPASPDDVARAVKRRAVEPLGGDSALLASAVDPRCAFAVILRYTPRVARLLHTIVSGDGTYRAIVEPKVDLSLARMSAEHALRSFVIWPPVVHLQRDDMDTPTDGYGGNSTRFIEAWLETETTRRRG